MTLDQLKEELQKLTTRECWCDDTQNIVNDLAGGNIDDAYAGGYADGEAKLAKYILQQLSMVR